MSMHTTLEGGKTRLRPALWGFSEEELRRRYRWSLDDELQYWSGSLPGASSFEQFKVTVRQRDWPDDGRRISYAILTKDTDLIGMVSCYGIDRRPNLGVSTGELGVYIGQKTHWGKGYGTDAIVTFLAHLFGRLDFQSVYLHTYESNVRAQRSYLNVGFEVEDRRRRYSARVGYHDELRMRVTRERFQSLHPLRERATAS